MLQKTLGAVAALSLVTSAVAQKNNSNASNSSNTSASAGAMAPTREPKFQVCAGDDFDKARLSPSIPKSEKVTDTKNNKESATKSTEETIKELNPEVKARINKAAIQILDKVKAEGAIYSSDVTLLTNYLKGDYKNIDKVSESAEKVLQYIGSKAIYESGIAEGNRVNIYSNRDSGKRTLAFTGAFTLLSAGLLCAALRYAKIGNESAYKKMANTTHAALALTLVGISLATSNSNNTDRLLAQLEKSKSRIIELKDEQTIITAAINLTVSDQVKSLK